MRRTTVHLPEGLKAALERLAHVSGRSEAELIREGVSLVVAQRQPRRPRLPLFTSDEPTLAENADDALEGFGEP